MKRSQRLVLPTLFGSAMLALASCGGSNDSAEIAELTPEAPAEVIAPEPEPAPSAELIDYLTRYNPTGPAENPPAQARETILGQRDVTMSTGFTQIPEAMASRPGMYGRTDAVEALEAMFAAAQTDGINLRVISAYRSFNDQKRIWNNKWTGVTLVEGGALPEAVPDPETRARKILEFSSMPGTSRHHWGTDFDLNSLNNSWFEADEGLAIYTWLTTNAADFGFCQVYNPKTAERPNGYEMEKWHWSYVPVAETYLAAYRDFVGYSALAEFEGADAARQIDVITNYVESINPACRS